MSDKPKTKGEMVIEQLMQELDPASERYQLLSTAKRFKSSWVELGEKLLKVQQHGSFRLWGYDSFEDYCSREIRIKRPTAEKLTQAYRYLEKEEPELLARRTELRPLPDFRSIDLLRQAREELEFPDESYAELRRAVVDEELSHPTVRRRFLESGGDRLLPSPSPEHSLRTALSAARRLQSALQQIPDPPLECGGWAESILACLEARIAEKTATEDPPLSNGDPAKN